MSDYEEFAAEYGGTGGGDYTDPKNPPVLISKGGKRLRVDDPRRSTAYGSRQLLSEVVLGVYRMDRDELADLQQRLFSGGFYGNAQPVAGDYDGAATAYARAGQRASRFLEAGVEMTLNEVIDKAAEGFAAQMAEQQQGRDVIVGGNVGGGGVYTINLSDPASLRQVADAAATAVLGRKASKEEAEKAVASIRAAQEAQQSNVAATTEAQRRAEFNARSAAERQRGAVTAAADNQRLASASIPAGQEITSDFVAQQGAVLAGQYGLSVTSHVRSPEKNKAVGGAPKSDHLSGHGIDLAGSPEKMAALAAWAKQNTGPGKLFRYVEYGTDDHKDHVHLSFNKGKSPGTTGAGSAIEGSRTIDLPDTYIDPAVVTSEQVDPEARMAEQLRALNGDEANAHDLATQFGRFLSIIGAK